LYDKALATSRGLIVLEGGILTKLRITFI